MELEWLVRELRNPVSHVPAERIAGAVGAFTGHGQMPSASPAVLSHPTTTFALGCGRR